MDDLLNDLEEFVAGDWKKIYDTQQDEEYKKEISEPVIPDFPRYEEFYKVLVSLIGRDIPIEVDFLIHKVLRNQDRKKTESFDNIWAMFCDPHKFKIEKHKCNCGVGYAVIIHRNSMPILLFENRDENRAVEQEMYIKQERVYCPKCGANFMTTGGERVIGVFENRRVFE